MKKTLLLFFFWFIVAFLPAQNKNILRIAKIDSTETIALDKYWKFHNGDDSTWASTSFDDSSWDTVKTNLGFKNDSTVFTGIAWFRIHFYIDSSLNDTPLAILINQDGASQIFLDGKLLHSLGTVSANSTIEQKYNPNEIPLSFRYKNSGEHILAIRYSNLEYQKKFEKYRTNNPGFTIKIGKQDDLVKDKFVTRIVITSIAVVIGIFFLSLGFVHLLFFLFYRKHITNLYYSIFVFLFGSIFFIPAISFNSFDPELSITLNYSFWFFLTLFFYALLLLHYSLFKRPITKYFWFSTLILFVVLITLIFRNNNFTEYLLFSFIISTVVASFFMVIRSIRKKIDGAWIIGTGSLIFLLFLGFIIIKIMINNNFSIHSLFLIVLIFLALISIPVSMSVYLARQFAMTNNDLERKLVEVETLSAKSIDQEKEKQKILEVQKETLEIQVKERTFEIVEQKKVIEEKNKDITDSINYAMTIQQAILPSKELKFRLFPDSFILFKPKDIVSGDFFWFAEKNNKKIIAACDCTGHGVPGALMSMIGNNILNQIVNEKGITSPDEILNHLHKEIRKTLNQEEQNETKDGMDIAIITFISDTEIEFAGAQRPLWIVKSQENGDWRTENEERRYIPTPIPTPNSKLLSPFSQLTEIKGDKCAIGGWQSEIERKFTNHKISVEKGESIYISSDGFADQFSDTDNKLMTSRFKELLKSIQQKSMQEQEIYLSDFIEKWRGKREQIDDILVIGIRI